MKETDGVFGIEGYELGEPVTGDSWGELYEAVYVPHRRPVLFRRFARCISSEGPWRLAAAEVQAWARIDHPAVLQPLDWGNPAAGPFAALEMPRGRPLSSMIGEREGLAVDDPQRVFSEIAKAVEAARIYGVLHLGLGLSNVWVSGDGVVQVSDFGLWYLSSEFPELELEAGRFRAPEQEAGGRVGAATDVYSLGLLLVAIHLGLEGAARAAEEGTGFDRLVGPAGDLARRCLAADPLDRPRSAGLLTAENGSAVSVDAGFRDCPVCRLKREIARGRGQGDRKVAERLLDLDGCGLHPDESAAESTEDEQAFPAGDERATWTPTASFWWVAIAALTVATLIVWWLAFR